MTSLTPERSGIGVFYGVVDRWVGPDRLYKVFVTPDAVHAARVGGGWGVFLGRLAVLGELAPIFPLKVVAKPALEARYQDLDPRAIRFLALDRRNFRLNAAQVTRVHLAALWVFGSRRRRATVTFHRRDHGRRVRFHVIPSDLAAIHATLDRTAFRVEVDAVI